jgi:hypothetical protein
MWRNITRLRHYIISPHHNKSHKGGVTLQDYVTTLLGHTTTNHIKRGVTLQDHVTTLLGHTTTNHINVA